MVAPMRFRVFGIDIIEEGRDGRNVTTHMVWEWTDERGPQVDLVLLEGDESREVERLLADALPARRDDEDDAAMVERVLTDGALSDLPRELEFSTTLAGMLIPDDARAALRSAIGADVRPLVRLMPAQSLAQVPWELLVVADGEDGSDPVRLLDVADTVYDVSDGIHESRSREPRPWPGDESSTYYLIDPVTRVEGSVLGTPDPEISARVAASAGSPAVGASVTRADLSAALTSREPPDRLVYVGHVAHSDLGSGSTGMILSDSPFVYGRGSVVERVGEGGRAERTRPLVAADFIEGTLGLSRYLPELEIVEKVHRDDLRAPTGGPLTADEVDGSKLWPMPPRVLLVACDSGGDMRDAEPFGLATALVNSGAGTVVATKWTLLTDHAARSVARTDEKPLTRLVLDADDALSAPDPIAAVCDYQRQRLREWVSAPTPASSPLTWAALSAYDGSTRTVRPYVSSDSRANRTGSDTEARREFPRS